MAELSALYSASCRRIIQAREADHSCSAKTHRTLLPNVAPAMGAHLYRADGAMARISRSNRVSAEGGGYLANRKIDWLRKAESFQDRRNIRKIIKQEIRMVLSKQFALMPSRGDGDCLRTQGTGASDVVGRIAENEN